ncbi:TetR/AcrR family transcriptional regulator [Streptomyces sp. NBC_01356]|uniref:TetR/AcrR family transcriptional regulator n=1 Tax=Streptomyces sp. NBC_01356 TaxID=2903836 RepID=UPI002E2FEE71|nr:helix-turn-helix domain-containing protein [Streptomyces sp. NBC_01356]
MTADKPRQPPLRKDAERNRRLILAAAREVFRDRGVAATLNDVAHHAHLGVGTVYRRFANKEELVDALFGDMVDTVDRYLTEALAEEDAWLGLTRCLEQVCEVQSFDRGLREVMLGTGHGPARQAQIHGRLNPAVQRLLARAQEQGKLRADVVPSDFPVLQLMTAAVSEFDAGSDAWRRYLAILIDGLRARPDVDTLPPGIADVEGVDQALVDASAHDARSRQNPNRDPSPIQDPNQDRDQDQDQNQRV